MAGQGRAPGLMAPLLPPKNRAMLSIERASGSPGVCGASGGAGALWPFGLGSWPGEGGLALVIQEATKGLEEAALALAPNPLLPVELAAISWLSSS
jgi:hypothetical protein